MTPAAVAAAPRAQVRTEMIELGDLRPSPSNPRRHFDQASLEELAESLKSQGMVQAMLVRPSKEGFEIVCGERRYRAAKQAGWKRVPCEVRNLNDDQVLEIQLVENCQREDVHPMDEALAYQTLRDRNKLDVATIAKKVGKKSAGFIYQRLKLAELQNPARAAYLENKLTFSHALNLARLQPRDQAAAFEFCFKDRYGNRIKDPRPVRELLAWIAQELQLNLAGSPWKKDDKDLVPRAGSCAECPKRSGNSPELYSDVKSPNMCMDRSCYQAKVQAWIERRRAELKKEGHTIYLVSPEYGATRESGILNPRQYSRIRAGQKSCKKASKAIAVDGGERYSVFDICTDDKCPTHNPNREYRGPSPAAIAKQRREEKLRTDKVRRESAFRLKLFDEILARIRAPLPRPALERLAARMFLEMWHQNRALIERRHGWRHVDAWAGAQSSVLETELRKMLPDELAQLLMEMSLIRFIPGGSTDRPNGKDGLLEAAAWVKVNPAKVRQTMTLEGKRQSGEEQLRKVMGKIHGCSKRAPRGKKARAPKRGKARRS